MFRLELTWASCSGRAHSEFDSGARDLFLEPDLSLTFSL
jgi:hypothetical protein